MPARNVVRSYQENGYYHVYNRGVEKRTIFLDQQDYRIFLYYLFIYLAPPAIIAKAYPKLPLPLRNNNLYGKISLIAYVLMGNHFHLLVKQDQIDATTKLLRRVSNGYTQYFNKKHHRVGGLFQGVFKAVPVETDEYLLHLTRYIHQNPLKLLGNTDGEPLSSYPWSSYPTYLGIRQSSYLDPTTVLSFFSTTNKNHSYQDFVTSTTQPTSLPDHYLIDKDDCC